jgi:glutamate/tyrosine decarboxylase-like PLP-dependent enzyme
MSEKTSEKNPSSNLQLDAATRREVWAETGRLIENYVTTIAERHVVTEMTPAEVRMLFAGVDFAKPLLPGEALRFAADSLARTQVNVGHPRYFGLFNPAPTTMGIAADTLVAALNPQLATWKHAPFAAEAEQFLIRAFGERFGYAAKNTDGTFAMGGSEANHTALLTALTAKFSGWQDAGVRALPAQPVFYISSESHHSFQKMARLTGIGSESVRVIPADAKLRMDVNALRSAIYDDRKRGLAPFMIVATVGTTSAGVIDPLPELANAAESENLWLHADAAWGGAAALVPELRPLLDGIERADSITLDAHKWLSVPMAAGVYLTRHPEILGRTFRIAAAYLPPKADGVEDPVAHSIQWSRRFIGLKLFLSLAVAGWDGYAEAMRHMTNMGAELRRELVANGWEIANDTPLPVVCFNDARNPERNSAEELENIVSDVVASGQAWISTTRVGAGKPVLRACITNYLTTSGDLNILVSALEEARRRAAGRMTSTNTAR